MNALTFVIVLLLAACQQQTTPAGARQVASPGPPPIIAPYLPPTPVQASPRPAAKLAPKQAVDAAIWHLNYAKGLSKTHQLMRHPHE